MSSGSIRGDDARQTHAADCPTASLRPIGFQPLMRKRGPFGIRMPSVSIAMNKKLLALGIILLVPAWSWAQKMERPKDPDVGDQIVRNWVLNNKAQQITQTVEAVTDTEIQESQKVGDRTFDLVLPRSNLAVSKVMCESNGQPCAFAPALELSASAGAGCAGGVHCARSCAARQASHAFGIDKPARAARGKLLQRSTVALPRASRPRTSHTRENFWRSCSSATNVACRSLEGGLLPRR
jgi:hypothetical protein